MPLGTPESKRLTCVVVSLMPSLYQETEGDGLPAAEHNKLILPEFLKKNQVKNKNIYSCNS